MASKRLTTYILFNAIMGFFLFLSSQFVLYILNGKIVQGIGIFIDYGFPYADEPIPTTHAPLPNYPLFVFIIMLTVNIFFYFRLNRLLHSKTIS